MLRTLQKLVVMSGLLHTGCSHGGSLGATMDAESSLRRRSQTRESRRQNGAEAALWERGEVTRAELAGLGEESGVILTAVGSQGPRCQAGRCGLIPALTKPPRGRVG